MADPQPQIDRLARPQARVVPADRLERADQGRRAFELLQGEQPQGVTHDDGDTSVTGVPEPAEQDDERDETEVGLGLAAAGGEPEQIGQPSVVVLGVGETAEIQKDEGDLERSPDLCGARRRRRGRPGADPVLPASLLLHRGVHEPERLELRSSAGEQIDAALHAVGRGAGGVEMALRRWSERRVECRDLLVALRDPVQVVVDERTQRLRHVVGLRCERDAMSRSASADAGRGVERGTSYEGRNVVSIDPTMGSVVSGPLHGAPVSDGEGSRVAEEQFVGVQVLVADGGLVQDPAIGQGGRVGGHGDVRLEPAVRVAQLVLRHRGRVPQHHGHGRHITGSVHGRRRRVRALARPRPS